MSVEIITIGDELVFGLLADTNAAFIGRRLAEVGLPVARMTTVGDELDRITAAIREARDRAQVVIVTGGLGPTHDDVTAQAVCRAFDRKLVLFPGILDELRRRYEGLGRSFPDNMERQAMLPEACDALPNEKGTAPGIHIEDGNRHFFAVPGVPMEMRDMLSRQVLPRIAPLAGARTMKFTVIRTTGISEANLHQALEGVISSAKEVAVSFLPSFSGVDVRLTSIGEDRERLESAQRRMLSQIEERVGRFIYSVGDESLEEVVEKHLREKGLKLAVAESCTGGLICKKLTDIPGSSDVFLQGYIVYSNRAKCELLGVPESTIERHGAVSEETAIAMARGARSRSGADIAVSTTGIAGPGGATPGKPVGLTYVGYADADRGFARRFIYGGDREANRERASASALGIIRSRLLSWE